MQTKINKTMLLVMFNFPIILWGQWTEIPKSEFGSILSSVEHSISTSNSFSYDMTLCMYSNHTKNDTLYWTSSTMRYNAKTKTLNYTQFSNNVVQNGKYMVVCDTTEQTITILDADTNFSKPRTLEAFDIVGDEILKLEKMSKGKAASYRVYFTSGYYEMIEYHLDESGKLERIISYMAEEMLDESDWGQIKYVKPRIEMHFSNYQFGKTVEKSKFEELSQYIKIENTITLQENYKGFELINLMRITAE
jgi:hypothetical protein